MNVEFLAAKNIPRLVMQTAVEKIKKGDIVRIIYADGAVFDFETTRDCSRTIGFACEYSGNGTRVSGPDAPATLSRYAFERAEANADQYCFGGSGSRSTFDVPIGYWAVSYPPTGSVITVVAQFVSTGSITFSIANMARARPRCR